MGIIRGIYMNFLKEYAVKGLLFFSLLVFVIFPLGNKLIQKACEVRAAIIVSTMTENLKGKSMTEIKDYFTSGKYDPFKYGEIVLTDLPENHVQVDFFHHKSNKDDKDTIYCSIDIYAKNTLINIERIPMEYAITKKTFYPWILAAMLIIFYKIVSSALSDALSDIKRL